MLVRTGYWQLRRREGIGLGDAKLLAAAGAWVAWQGLPSVVLIAAVAGLLAAALARWRNLILGRSRSVWRVSGAGHVDRLALRTAGLISPAPAVPGVERRCCTKSAHILLIL